ncbi:MAG: toll/interleukin-1 receptor domain-containing protein [Pseudomonadota bacterium]
MADVFISYARKDADRARLIKARLEALGLSVFFDTEGLDGGDVFPDVLDWEVKAAGAVVGVWTRHALTRPWIKIECDIGRARGVLVPVQIEDIPDLERPAAFWNVQHIDMEGFEADVDHPGWPKLIRSLARTLDRPDILPADAALERERPAPKPARAHRRADPTKGPRRAIAGLAMLAVVASIGFAALAFFGDRATGSTDTRWAAMPAHEWWSQSPYDVLRRVELETPMSEIPELAASGDAAALTVQGLAQRESYGIAGGPTGAYDSFRIACERGHEPGCLYYATVLSNGAGGPQDGQRALEISTDLCQRNAYPACALAGGLLMGATGLAPNTAKAEPLLRRGCDGGDASSCGGLQALHEGAGPAADAIARCRANDPYSCLEAAKTLDQVRGTDTAEAVSYYELACNGRVVEGCLASAAAYDAGAGVREDAAYALSYYGAACDLGELEGCWIAGVMYEQGRGVAKDLDLARGFYDYACSNGSEEGCELFEALKND